MSAFDLSLAVQVLHKLCGEAFLRREVSTSFAKDTTNVVPWALILRGEPDEIFSKLYFAVHDVSWDLVVFLHGPASWSAVAGIGKHDEESVRPSRVIANVIIYQRLARFDLGRVIALRWEQVKLANHILAVRPDMVVLGVCRKHLSQEVDFRLGKTKDGVAIGGDSWVEFVYKKLAMVPDLIVFLIFRSDLADPLKFLSNGVADGKDDVGTIEPDGVVSRIEFDDVAGQIQAPLAVLLLSHHGAQIRDCFIWT